MTYVYQVTASTPRQNEWKQGIAVLGVYANEEKARERAESENHRFGPYDIVWVESVELQ